MKIAVFYIIILYYVWAFRIEAKMSIIQKEIVIEQKRRGFHIITDEILRQVPEIRNILKGFQERYYILEE